MNSASVNVLSLVLLQVVFCLQPLQSYAWQYQVSPEQREIDFIDSFFSDGADMELFPGLSLAFVAKDTAFVSSYGVKSWGLTAPITDNTLFQLGSVGKVMTAICVLQLVELGKLSLEEDVNKYLPFNVSNPYSRKGLTIMDLLTHSAGLNDKNIGYLVRDSMAMQPLLPHLMEAFPSFYQKPGVDISYSNYSYALAGLIVEQVSNTAFEDYVSLAILDPLRMDDSFVGFDFQYLSDSSYAIGHTIEDSTFKRSVEFARNAIPAGSFVSSANDMRKFALAIATRDSTILQPDSWNLLFTRQFSNDPSMPGYSLCFEEQTIGGQSFWAKGGMLQGYLSQLVVWPNNSVLFLATNCHDDSFLEEFHSAFKNEFFGDTGFEATHSVEVDLAAYVGEYRDSRYDREGVENIISLFRGAFSVWEGENGIQVYHNGEIHEYTHVGNHLFQNQTNSDEKIRFVENEGQITKLYRGVNIGGMAIPSTFERTSWYNSPTFVNEYYGVVLVVVALYGLIALIVILVHFVRRVRYTNDSNRTYMPLLKYVLAVFGVLLIAVHIARAVLPLVRKTEQFLFGLPPEFIHYNQIGILVAICTMIYWLLLFRSTIKKEGSRVSRLFFMLFTLAFSAHTLFLYYWNFLKIPF